MQVLEKKVNLNLFKSLETSFDLDSNHIEIGDIKFIGLDYGYKEGFIVLNYFNDSGKLTRIPLYVQTSCEDTNTKLRSKISYIIHYKSHREYLIYCYLIVMQGITAICDTISIYLPHFSDFAILFFFGVQI